MQQEMGKDAESVSLSRKHDEFCWEYIQCCGNGSQAYQRVYPGVKNSTARANASKLLTDANIKTRIDEILLENKKRHAILADRVIEYHRNTMMLNRIGLLDPQTGRVKPVEMLSPEALQVLEVEQVSAKEGIRTLLKIPTRHASAVELAKILGLNKDKMELTGKDGESLPATPVTIYIPANGRD